MSATVSALPHYLDLDRLLLCLGLLGLGLRDLLLDELLTGDRDLDFDFFRGDRDLFLFGDLERDLESLRFSGDFDLVGEADFLLDGDIDFFRSWVLLRLGDTFLLVFLFGAASGESSKRYLST